ncbi:hypothetical protein ACFU8W_23775 [Streptomyces sp. NPDC057565]|uniref:hypothetical protein n=1 Tax=Streptomyces sp. NPDC057565 TaxID=3346169 RepID=UPI0036BD23B9
MSGMQSVQVGAKTGKARGSLGSASVVLFVLGSFDAGIYLAELITDGDRYVAMLESGSGLLFASWIAGAVHLLRIRKVDRQNS